MNPNLKELKMDLTESNIGFYPKNKNINNLGKFIMNFPNLNTLHLNL